MMQTNSGFTRLAIVILVVFELALGLALFGALKDLGEATLSVAESGVPPEVTNGPITEEYLLNPGSALEIIGRSGAYSNRMDYEMRVSRREDAQQTVYILVACMFAIPILCVLLFWTLRWVAAGFRVDRSE